MREISTEELKSLLERLDDVCRQARELSDTIRRRMVQSARENLPAGQQPRGDNRKTGRRSNT